MTMSPPYHRLLLPILLLLQVGVSAFAPLLSHHHHAAAAITTTRRSMAEGSGDAVTKIPGPPYSGPAAKPILDSIDTPEDMKRLDMRELKQVSFRLLVSSSCAVMCECDDRIVIYVDRSMLCEGLCCVE